MSRLPALLRLITHCRGSATLILAVALVAVAAAATGHANYADLRRRAGGATPCAPPLPYMSAVGLLAGLLGRAVGLLILVTVTISVTVVRGVRMDQLCEAPA